MGSGAGGGWRCSLGDGSHCEADSIVRSTAPYCCYCCSGFHPGVSQGHKIKVISVAVLAWYKGVTKSLALLYTDQVACNIGMLLAPEC